jgi:hypothetical protein
MDPEAWVMCSDLKIIARSFRPGRVVKLPRAPILNSSRNEKEATPGTRRGREGTATARAGINSPPRDSRRHHWQSTTVQTLMPAFPGTNWFCTPREELTLPTMRRQFAAVSVYRVWCPPSRAGAWMPPQSGMDAGDGIRALMPPMDGQRGVVERGCAL